MGQSRATKDNRLSTDETVFPNFYRLGGLAAGRQIDAVGNELRTKASDGRERTDADSCGAIDQMPAADSRVRFDDQLGTPVRLMREMPARAAGEAGDPIQLADDGVGTEMQKVDVLAKGEMPDAGVLLHDEPARENPGEADVAGGMKGIAELFLEKRAPERPRQQERKKHQDFFHQAGARAW